MTNHTKHGVSITTIEHILCLLRRRISYSNHHHYHRCVHYGRERCQFVCGRRCLGSSTMHPCCCQPSSTSTTSYHDSVTACSSTRTRMFTTTTTRNNHHYYLKTFTSDPVKLSLSSWYYHYLLSSHSNPSIHQRFHSSTSCSSHTSSHDHDHDHNHTFHHHDSTTTTCTFVSPTGSTTPNNKMLLETTQQLQTPPKQQSFHRRILPTSCIALSSPKGKELFASAFYHKGCQSFFELMEHFLTQSEPAYCGISTLVMVLNALAVDPRITWKGPWRFYSEQMLNCCIDPTLAKTQGITWISFLRLAKCQGLQIQDVLAQNSSIEQFRQCVKDACMEEQKEEDDMISSGGEVKQLLRERRRQKRQTQTQQQQRDSTVLPSSCEECVVAQQQQPKQNNQVLVVSYDRRTLGQTGSGHFSPIGAYDPISDKVLILDVARFKYSPHWVDLPLLFKAMTPIDPDTGTSRGYVTFRFQEALLKCQQQLLPQSKLFESISTMKQYRARQQYNEQILSQLSTSGMIPSFNTDDGSNDDKHVRPTFYYHKLFQKVVHFWTHTYHHGSGSSSSNTAGPENVWDIIEPHLIPIDPTERDYAIELVHLLKELVDQFCHQQEQEADEKEDEDENNAATTLISNETSSSTGTLTTPLAQTSSPLLLRHETCLTSLHRKLNIRPIDGMFIIFLASLSTKEERWNVLQTILLDQSRSSSSIKEEDNNNNKQPPNTTLLLMEQILMEAELVRLAIEYNPELEEAVGPCRGQPRQDGACLHQKIQQS